jgi:hypothetical protein
MGPTTFVVTAALPKGFTDTNPKNNKDTAETTIQPAP